MLKSYKELMGLDLSNAVDKKIVNKKTGESVDYISWAKCIDLLHENGAEVVYYEPLVNEADGGTLFSTGTTFTNLVKTYVNRQEEYVEKKTKCYEVRVRVVIDDLEFVQSYPLIKGKDPLYEDEINQFVVDYAQKRAFVKGVAIRTGLGLSLWIKEEKEQEKKIELAPVDISYMTRLKEYAQELYTKAFTFKKIPQEEIVKKMGVANFDVLKANFAKFDELEKFLADLDKLAR